MRIARQGRSREEALNQRHLFNVAPRAAMGCDRLVSDLGDRCGTGFPCPERRSQAQ